MLNVFMLVEVTLVFNLDLGFLLGTLDVQQCVISNEVTDQGCSAD